MFKCSAGVAWNLEKTHGAVRLKKRCIRTSTVHRTFNPAVLLCLRVLDEIEATPPF